MVTEQHWEREPDISFQFHSGTSLGALPTDATSGFRGGRDEANRVRVEEAATLATLQEQLFAGGLAGRTESVLLIMQGMDTAGKGGVIRRLVAEMHPHGVRLASFGAPTVEERAHDFLWRIRKEVPRAGQVGIFDRSHYEDVLVGRIRPVVPPDEIEARYAQITEFEEQLQRNGTALVKVMLHVGFAEQKRRLQRRLDDPDRQWKFDPRDIDDRLAWGQFQNAYQIALERTSTSSAPWYVIPADHKWFARMTVQHLVVRALQARGLSWPEPLYDVAVQRARLDAT